MIFAELICHYSGMILAYAALLGVVLVALCFALDRSPLGPLRRACANKIIDYGYWGGLAAVMLYLLLGPANSASASSQFAPVQTNVSQNPLLSPSVFKSSPLCQPEWVCRGIQQQRSR